MNKYIVTAILLIAAIAIIFWWTKKTKKNTVVLGEEMAKASEKEKQRIESGEYSISPLPAFNYSKWKDEQSLINPVENELDTQILRLCQEFKNYSGEKRKGTINSISQDNIYTLLGFSKRASLFAIRKKQMSYLENGFIAIAMIDAERCDPRDISMTLGFLNFGAQHLKMNDAEIIEKVIGVAESKTAELVKRFFEVHRGRKSTEGLSGYIPIETVNGIGFIETNYKRYAAEHDLIKILFDVSDFVFRDKYLKGEITTATELPSYWMSADNDKKIEQIISHSSGCANLSTYMKDDSNPELRDQMLLIFLTEFENPHYIQLLNDQAQATSPKSFSRLTITEGNILCIIIQRAVVEGKKDFETSESLKRFESPLRKIISAHLSKK